jgi:hypothetical protein
MSPSSLLSDHRRVADSGRAKYAAIALDFLWWPHGLRIIVGELDCRPTVSFVHLANQADWIKSAATGRIATAKIVG